MSACNVNVYQEVSISFAEYIAARALGKFAPGTSPEDALMSMFRERGIKMDSESDMKPTPPVEIITDKERGVFVVKQWQTNSL